MSSLSNYLSSGRSFRFQSAIFEASQNKLTKVSLLKVQVEGNK